MELVLSLRDFQVIRYTENYLYDFSAIISAVGGSMGLFLGFSFYSMSKNLVDRVLWKPHCIGLLILLPYVSESVWKSCVYRARGRTRKHATFPNAFWAVRYIKVCKSLTYCKPRSWMGSLHFPINPQNVTTQYSSRHHMYACRICRLLCQLHFRFPFPMYLSK